MATADDSNVTLLRGASPRTAGRIAGRTAGWTLPPDLREEAARRTRAVALLYATAYFLVGVLPLLISREGRAMLFGRASHWMPAVLSIADALLLAWLVGHPRFSTRVKVCVGLAFEIIGSYGIAAAEYHGIAAPIRYRDYSGDFGLSWVSVWVMLFTSVVPAPPRIVLLAAALSLSAVPVMYALGDNVALAPMAFFLMLVFPYMVVLLTAYVASRVVYGLGAEVTRAREMGSYRLGERLGKGGMGEVWRA